MAKRSGSTTRASGYDLWIIFNRIYDSEIGIEMYSAAAPNIYIIGNEFHDIIGAAAIQGTSDSGSAGVRVVNNTIITSVSGITRGEAKSNIVQATTTAIGGTVIGCSHNHVQAGTVSVSCSNGTSGDPRLIIDANGHVTGLQSDSPAIDTGFADHSAYDTFQTTFGRSIKFDRVGVARPQGAGWDRGAFEFGVPPDGVPPSAPTTLRVQ